MKYQLAMSDHVTGVITTSIHIGLNEFRDLPLTNSKHLAIEKAKRLADEYDREVYILETISPASRESNGEE